MFSVLFSMFSVLWSGVATSGEMGVSAEEPEFAGLAGGDKLFQEQSAEHFESTSTGRKKPGRQEIISRRRAR
jgi:hypothetical protein